MAVLLKELLEEIGSAVSNANYELERAALWQYITQGYGENKSNGEEPYTPLTFNMALQDGGEIRKIPVSALLHNTTMRLDRVDITLRFKMFDQNGEVMVECAPSGIKNETLDEMQLRFRNSAPTEGISKVTDHYLKKI